MASPAPRMNKLSSIFIFLMIIAFSSFQENAFSESSQWPHAEETDSIERMVDIQRQRAKRAAKKAKKQMGKKDAEDADLAKIRSDVVKIVLKFNKGIDQEKSLETLRDILKQHPVFLTFVINQLKATPKSISFIEEIALTEELKDTYRISAAFRLREVLPGTPSIQKTLISILNNSSEDDSLRDAVSISLMNCKNPEVYDALSTYLTEPKNHRRLKYMEKFHPDEYRLMIDYLQKFKKRKYDDILRLISSFP